MIASEVTNELHKKTSNQHLEYLIGRSREFVERARQVREEELDGLAVESALQRQQLENDASRDPLTNVFGPRYFEETFPREIARDVSMGKPYVLALCDADDLKLKNDTEPDHHDAGDRYLQAIAAIASEEAAKIPGAFVARLKKGDEFAICLPGLNANDGKKVMETIRKRIVNEVPDRAKLTIPKNRTESTISIGITQIWHGMTAKKAVEEADNALYSSKQKGKNRTTIFRPK